MMPPVTKNLLIINVLVWAFMALSPSSVSMRIDELLGLHYISSPAFRVWQPLTYMFVHGGLTHLFFNMFALMMFGAVIEMTISSRRFVLYYLICGLGAALFQEVVYYFMIQPYASMFTPEEYTYIINRGFEAMREGQMFTDPQLAHLAILVNTATVGASGAIYGVLLAFGMLFPNRELYLMFIPVPIKAKWMIIGYCVLELTLGVTGTADGVAHFAHLGGMVCGFIIMLYWKHKGYYGGGFGQY